jgi:phenylalanyl-tRNA synthetase beta chain
LRVPLSWLRDFAPFSSSPAQLAESLDELGLVVEELQNVGTGLSDVVVARVLGIESIPGADRVRKVVVEAGDEPLEIVCGAWNFSEGDLVALAPLGSMLPDGLEIAKKKVKGVTSHGMLCSGRELQLSDDAEGILVLSEGEPGVPLTEALGLEPDAVFDVAVDANRPDAACVAGVARDLAAKLGLPFSIPEPEVHTYEGQPRAADLVSVEVRDLDLCPRFTTRVMTGIEVGPSPREVVRRLVLAGMRPINNVVDASNYVMMELGQPTHPYDLEKLAGDGLVVRAARPEEALVVRGDDMRDCLICDANDDPVGIGGVMGGSSSEIEESTTRVLLESAYFSPMAIARTSKRLGLRTEASARFERGVDPQGLDRAALRLWEVLAPSAGASARLAGGLVDVKGELPEPARVRVRTSRLNSVLGTQLTDDEIASNLEPIGFVCDTGAPGSVVVDVPSFRPDTSREIDVIEEVARHHGYARIARRRLFPPQVGGLSAYQKERRFVRDVIAGTGADEAWTPSMLAPGDHQKARIAEDGESGLVLANPLTPEESVLRLSLLPGMIKALAFNATRRQGELRLFEIGHVFPMPSSDRVTEALEHRSAATTVVDEREMLGVLQARQGDGATSVVRTWLTLVQSLGLTGLELAAPSPEVPLSNRGMHPTRSANIVVSTVAVPTASDPPREDELPLWSVLGAVGEVDPDVLEAFGLDATERVGWLEVDLGALLCRVRRKSHLARPVSRFPSNDIDLAFLVDEAVPAGSVTATLSQAGGELLESLELFDVYRGAGVAEGSRSLTWKLRFCALDHTLTDEEVAIVRKRCIEAVERAHGARLRS